jgi:hypothetical protein
MLVIFIKFQRATVGEKNHLLRCMMIAIFHGKLFWPRACMVFENCRTCFFDNSLYAKIAMSEWFFKKLLNLALDEFENLATARVYFPFAVIIKMI